MADLLEWPPRCCQRQRQRCQRCLLITACRQRKLSCWRRRRSGIGVSLCACSANCVGIRAVKIHVCMGGLTACQLDRECVCVCVLDFSVLIFGSVYTYVLTYANMIIFVCVWIVRVIGDMSIWNFAPTKYSNNMKMHSYDLLYGILQLLYLSYTKMKAN